MYIVFTRVRPLYKEWVLHSHISCGATTYTLSAILSYPLGLKGFCVAVALTTMANTCTPADILSSEGIAEGFGEDVNLGERSATFGRPPPPLRTECGAVVWADAPQEKWPSRSEIGPTEAREAEESRCGRSRQVGCVEGRQSAGRVPDAGSAIGHCSPGCKVQMEHAAVALTLDAPSDNATPSRCGVRRSARIDNACPGTHTVPGQSTSRPVGAPLVYRLHPEGTMQATQIRPAQDAPSLSTAPSARTGSRRYGAASKAITGLVRAHPHTPSWFGEGRMHLVPTALDFDRLPTEIVGTLRWQDGAANVAPGAEVLRHDRRGRALVWSPPAGGLGEAHEWARTYVSDYSRGAWSFLRVVAAPADGAWPRELGYLESSTGIDDAAGYCAEMLVAAGAAR